jgi:hypothetical protein
LSGHEQDGAKLRREVEIMDLTNIVNAEWRAYPAAALALYGLALLANGLWFGFRGSDGLLREREALGWMRGFRLAVVGLCVVGIAVAWVWQVLWLFVAAVGIMGEELLETSVIIEVLKRAPSARSRPPTSPCRPSPPAPLPVRWARGALTSG